MGTNSKKTSCVQQRFTLDISDNFKTTVAVTFCFGFILHIVAITGMLINHDVLSIGIDADYTWLISQGKWFFGVVRKLFDVISAGSIVSVMAITFISLSAGLIVSILKIRNKYFSCIMGLFMVSFPSVMCTFAYDGEDVFFFAMLLSVMSVYIVQNFKHGYVWGTIFLTLSIGTYQTYIGMAASLFMFLCLIDLLENKSELKAIIFKGIQYILVLIASMSSYYVILQIAVQRTGWHLSSYQNIDSLGTVDWIHFPQAIIESYMKVIKFFTMDASGTGDTKFKVAYWLVLILCIVYFIYFVKKNKLFKKPLTLIVALILFLATPFTVHAVGILGQNANTHWLMIYPFVLIFVLLVKFSDMSFDKQEATDSSKKCNVGSLQMPLSAIMQHTVCILSVVIIFNWFVLTNMGYTRMRIDYEGAYERCSQIVSSILQQEEFTADTKIAVIGVHIPTVSTFPEMRMFTGIADSDMFYIERLYRSMIKDYLAIDFNYLLDTEADTIITTDQFQNMPVYPYNGYTQEIDGVIVVKMGEKKPTD